MDLLFEAAGHALAGLYIWYGLLFLLAGIFLWLHALVLLLLVLATRKDVPRFPRVMLFAELLYGFVNPLVYLVILQRAAFAPRYALLTGLAWVLFLAVWGSRLWGGLDRFRGSAVTRWCVCGLLVLALLCLGAFFAKDVLGPPVLGGLNVVGPPSWIGLRNIAVGLSVGALYMIPGILILKHLRSTQAEARWASGKRFFLLSKRVAAVTAALFLLTTAASWYRPSASRVEQLVLEHRAEIVTAAEKLRIDPRLIASILYVTQRDHVTPFARQLERAAMGAWLADLTNNFFLAKPLDASIGIAQIKPLTALTGLVIYAAAPLPQPDQYNVVWATDLVWATVSGLGHPVNYKEYRGIPRLGRRWRLAPEAVRPLDPPFRTLVPKSQIVEALFDDRLNIEMCALILSLYAIQWEAADPTWSIRRRPEILATLYQLGFEKSEPKANPRPNRFGERVLEVYESPWMREHFGSR